MFSNTPRSMLPDTPAAQPAVANATRVTLGRLQNLWRTLGLGMLPSALFPALIEAYSQSHRRYHTLQHLDECLQHLDRVASAAERPHEVELALWFHDAIYQTRGTDNELRSACWARDTATAAGHDDAQAERLFHLVMATQHDHAPTSPDACLLVDIDLAILGATPARFDKYERQVREEYAWVPKPLYQRRRRQLLRGFLARADLYSTAALRSTHEGQARENLRRSLAQ